MKEGVAEMIVINKRLKEELDQMNALKEEVRDLQNPVRKFQQKVKENKVKSPKEISWEKIIWEQWKKQLLM